MAQSVRDVVSLRRFLESTKKSVPFTQGLVLSTVPRGGLQVAQPQKLSAGIVRSYNQGFHAEDRLSWHCIVARKPVSPLDCWKDDEFFATAYWREFMIPLRLQHVMAFPLQAPILHGFPGSVHLCRTEEQGEFTSTEIAELTSLVSDFDQQVASARSSRKGGRCGPETTYYSMPPAAELTIVDAGLNAVLGIERWYAIDVHLREQMLEQVQRRTQQLNGHGVLSNRVSFPDVNGDIWNFQVVTYREYPAISDGPVSFFCLQPGCCEWGGIKPVDFEADPELARLIPSLRFMQKQYVNGPTLKDIAATAKLSPFHFHRRFTELLGLTPKQFMLDCQIHAAKTSLSAGDKELADIARECGFAHQSHFTSRFRQATGLTPTRWRRFIQERRKESAN